jgi:phospholipase/carboxylesterase
VPGTYPQLRAIHEASANDPIEPALNGPDLAGKQIRCRPALSGHKSHSRLRTWICSGLGGLALLGAIACRSAQSGERAQVETSATSVQTSVEEARDTPTHENPSGQAHADSLKVAGPIRYLEVFSANARADAALPIIVAIHGLGDTPENFSAFFADLPFPARIILPRGLDAYDGSFGTGWSWYPTRARDKDVVKLEQGISRASSAIAAGLAHLLATLPKKQQRVIVTGFSQGGMLSYALAAAHPELVHTAIPVSGLLPPGLWPNVTDAKNVHIVGLHGVDDKAVRIDPARETVKNLVQRGFSAELREFPGVGHQITPEMKALMVQLIQEASVSTP